MSWAKEEALNIINQRPDEKVYTIASGVSPSGLVHIGNFREIATPYLVVKELKKLGKEVRFILSFDEYDRFRKVPGNIPSEYDKYIGLPYSSIPSPFSENESYAVYFEKRFLKELEAMGIEAECIYQTKEYTNGRYNKYIKIAMDKRKEIFKIIDEYRTQDAEEGEIENYYPISIYCANCGKDTTTIKNYNNKTGDINYICSCGYEENIDINTFHNLKLQWKVDWPMRWLVENVTFETGGMDHSANNGSKTVAERISKEIFNFEPPIYIPYNFIGIKGGGAKMSSSTGNVLTLTDLLKVYDKHIIWWFYAKYKPMTAFDIALDNDVIRYFSEFDRWTKLFFDGNIDEKNRDIIELTDVTIDYLNYPSFNYLATFLPMVNYDIKMLKFLLSKENIECDNEYFEKRLSLAQYWIENYGSDYQLKLVEIPKKDIYDSLNEMELNWLKKTLEIINNDYMNSDDLQTDLYAVVKNDFKDEQEVKSAQKRFFQILYNLLLGADRGPKIGLFLLALPKSEIIKRISF